MKTPEWAKMKWSYRREKPMELMPDGSLRDFLSEEEFKNGEYVHAGNCIRRETAEAIEKILDGVREEPSNVPEVPKP